MWHRVPEIKAIFIPEMKVIKDIKHQISTLLFSSDESDEWLLHCVYKYRIPIFFFFQGTAAFLTTLDDIFSFFYLKLAHPTRNNVSVTIFFIETL